MPDVLIYTDGSCLCNPGSGGLGVILKHEGNLKEIAKGYYRTTNNRMELLAVITGLEALKINCDVTLYTDSQYVVNSINKKWLESWKKHNWIKSNGKRVTNIDLWERLIPLLSKHNVKFIWIKGHATNRDNNRCDMLAKEAASLNIKEHDIIYERENY